MTTSEPYPYDKYIYLLFYIFILRPEYDHENYLYIDMMYSSWLASWSPSRKQNIYIYQPCWLFNRHLSILHTFKMHGLFETVFAVLCISSVAYATPKPRNIDISIQIAENVLAVKHDAVTTVPGDIHTAEEFSATMMVRSGLRVFLSSPWT